MGLVHWDDPEGWNGEGGGRGVQDGEHMLIQVNVWQKPLKYCKVISLQLIKIIGGGSRHNPSNHNKPMDKLQYICTLEYYLTMKSKAIN